MGTDQRKTIDRAVLLRVFLSLSNRDGQLFVRVQLKPDSEVETPGQEHKATTVVSFTSPFIIG